VKAHWQRGMLTSGLALIGLLTISFSARVGIVTDQQALSESPAQTSYEISAAPLSDTLVYSLYLPIMMRPPGMLYGAVTEYGRPVSNVTISLVQCLTWFVNPGGQQVCATNTTYQATTNTSGGYAFIDLPTLVTTPGEVFPQTYRAYWGNAPATPDRLVSWNSQNIDSYTQGDVVNVGTFDIGGITLLTPASGSLVHFPVTFQWIPRHNVPSDRYNVCVAGGLIIPKFDPGDLICLGPSGYTNQVVMDSPFTGIDYGYGYEWYIEVPDDTGGIGYSSSVPFTFAAP
jgi:hypothetical protein